MVAALIAVVLAACAQIPTSGPVEEGSRQDEDSPVGIRYYPAGPTVGASKEEIVQGFLDAGTGIQNDYAVAREYLAGEAALTWRPQERVLVSESQASMKPGDGDDVVVTVPAYGNVDEHGFYLESLQTTTYTLDFTLEQIDGEWRITSAPNGVVLIRQAFADLYEPRELTFFDGVQKYTTTDLRWFPDDRRTPTRMVEELLNGPAAWLRPGDAVTSAFPRGSALVNSVRMNGSVAVVNFTDTLSNTSPGSLSLMRLQLEETLTALPGVLSVEMQINGATLDVSLPAPDDVVTVSEVSTMPLVQQGDRLGYLSGGDIAQPEGAENVAAEVERLAPIRGALSASRGTVALLTPEGSYAMRYEDESATLVDSRGGQIEPALDNWDWVWTQSTTETGLWLTEVGTNESYEISLPGDVEEDFVSHQVSRDGTRIVFLYEHEESVEVAISPIVRDDEGAPLYLGEPIVQQLPGERPNDVAWVDSNSVAMLIDSGEGTTDVRLYRVGGEFTVLGSIPSAMQTAGSNTLAGMRVVDRQGTLYAPRGTRWQASDTVVTFLYAQI